VLGGQVSDASGGFELTRHSFHKRKDVDFSKGRAVSWKMKEGLALEQAFESATAWAVLFAFGTNLVKL